MSTAPRTPDELPQPDPLPGSRVRSGASEFREEENGGH